MSHKARLLHEADEAFADLTKVIDGLTADQMGRVWLGTWSVREIVIHISGWHEAMIPALAHVAKGEAPYPPGTYDDFDAWNARFVERKSGAKTAEALAGLDTSHRDFVRAAGRVPDEQFAQGGAARGLFEDAGPAHYREHTAQIREWRERAAV